MNEHFWSNDELRTFLVALRRDGGFFGAAGEFDSGDRERFRRQAMLRIVPEVGRRVLADVGAAVDASGVAIVALEVAERTAWGKRHTWLMVTDDPWGYLTELVVREIRGAYRVAARPRGDAKALKGIAAASSRRGIAGGEDAAGPA